MKQRGPNSLSFQNHHLCHEQGFTLIELLVSITILAVILTVTYSSFTGILRMKKTLEERRETRQEANAVLRRLMSELQQATDASRLLPGPGSTSNTNSYDLDFRSVNETSGGGKRKDSITFMAADAGQFMPDGHHNAGIVQISYRLVETPDEYRIDSDTPTWTLVREEIPDITPFDQAYERAVRFPLNYRVTRFRFDYYTYESQSWQGEWADPPGRLPNLVRLTIGFLSASGREELFTTSVALASG